MSTETQNENKAAKTDRTMDHLVKKTANAGPAPGDGPKTIPVKCLTFFQPHPNFNAKSSISAEPAANKGRVIIEFVPSLRHHRVEVHSPGTAARVVFVYEGHVASFEPLL